MGHGMDKPLEIIRGQDGVLRDIHGRAMIMMFRVQGGPLTLEKPSHTVLSENQIISEASSHPFKFIPHASQPKAHEKKLIRSHVMRHCKSKERQRRKSQLLHLARKPTLHVVPYGMRIERHFKACVSSPNIPEHINERTLDPFATYPIAMQPQMYILLQHYLSTLVHAIYPPEPELYLLALSEPSLFHMILCNSAAYLNVLYAKPDFQECAYHNMKAVSRLRLDLKDSSSVTDARIATVAALGKYEVFTGNHDLWSVHRKGLIKMTEIGGGVEKLNFTIRAKICMVDLAGCIEDDTIPHFPFFDIVSPQIPLDTVATWNFGDFERILFLLTQEMVHILIGLHAFSGMLVSTATIQKSTDLDHHAAELRHRLLSCKKIGERLRHQDTIHEACRTGSLLYLETILRRASSQNRNCSTIIGRLRWTLEIILRNVSLAHIVPKEFILWLLFIGWTADARGLYKEWFEEQASTTISTLMIESHNNFMKALRKFLWLEERHHFQSLALWGVIDERGLRGSDITLV